MSNDDHYWRVICEWDIGLENVVFETRKVAYSETVEALSNAGIEDHIVELQRLGLIEFREVTFVMEKENG